MGRVAATAHDSYSQLGDGDDREDYDEGGDVHSSGDGDKDLPAYARFGALHRQALAEIKTLHNAVTRKKACDTLTDIRRQDASVFLSVHLWRRTQQCFFNRNN